MRRYQHAAAAVYPILYYDKVVVAGELVLVYAMQATLLGRAAQPVAVW